ncbi:TetR/AcrR family transcriptional regulator [Xanthomonas translucens]|uniref:TetR/AcrR family transcriptional regulator n=1 Tax=Xanthomonas campestris pv. translucens TaxID=343 RepID=UPI0019D59DAC|nr:TetR/AcrR family transcriptional regulator [Xanthomonas translucens]QSQ29411.1 TetR/AcrR family transcriptional regulator [Xanthomonas translucens pv. translucens]
MTASPAPLRQSQVRDQRVYAAVRELLAEAGMRLSMEAVAARAGCSKQTLYSRYRSKQDLLQRVIQDHTELSATHLGPAQGELRGSLLRFAREHLEQLSEPRVLQSCQLIAAEARHFPEQVRALFRDSAQALMQRLSERLQLAVAAGQLRHDDPHCMAELLLSMIVGMDFERQRFHTAHRSDAAAQRAWAEFAVDGFLRAFAAPTPASLSFSTPDRSTTR